LHFKGIFKCLGKRILVQIFEKDIKEEKSFLVESVLKYQAVFIPFH
jgi:hypothetical protein